MILGLISRLIIFFSITGIIHGIDVELNSFSFISAGLTNNVCGCVLQLADLTLEVLHFNFGSSIFANITRNSPNHIGTDDEGHKETKDYTNDGSLVLAHPIAILGLDYSLNRWGAVDDWVGAIDVHGVTEAAWGVGALAKKLSCYTVPFLIIKVCCGKAEVAGLVVLFFF
jgi:hypothetical protein